MAKEPQFLQEDPESDGHRRQIPGGIMEAGAIFNSKGRYSQNSTLPIRDLEHSM